MGLKHKNPFPATSDLDHFGDVTEMVLYSVPTDKTGQSGLRDAGLFPNDLQDCRGGLHGTFQGSFQCKFQ